jgi:hypothetical protein
MNTRTALLTLSAACAIAAGSSGLHAAPSADGAGPAATRTLRDVDAVKAALNRGLPVNASVDLDLCTPANGSAPSQTRGGLAVSPFRIQEDGTLSFADAHFAVSATGRPIMQNLRYAARPDGAIAVTSHIFLLPDYTLVSEASFACVLGNGVNFTTAVR